MNVSLTDGTAHDIALYAIDWDNQGRSEQIQITNAATGAVLDTETVSNFSGGVYLDWRVSGDVAITVTRLAGPSAVLSGLFLDAPPTTATPVTARHDDARELDRNLRYAGLQHHRPPCQLPLLRHCHSLRAVQTASGMTARSIRGLCRCPAKLTGSPAVGPPPQALPYT